MATAQVLTRLGRGLINGVAGVLCVGLALGLSYVIGVLLGFAVGAPHALGQIVGVVIGVLAALAWLFQPEPSRLARYLAIKLSILRDDAVIDTGYVSASVFVLVGYLLLIYGSLIGWGVLWLCKLLLN